MRALSLYLLQMRNPHRTSVADEHLVAFSKQHSQAGQVCNGYHSSFGELHQTYIYWIEYCLKQTMAIELMASVLLVQPR